MGKELTPLQKFDFWLKSKEEDGYKWNLARVYEEAEMLGYDKTHVDNVIAGLRGYYHRNANWKSLQNRKHWALAIMKNVTPKNFGHQSGRLVPSNFD